MLLIARYLAFAILLVIVSTLTLPAQAQPGQWEDEQAQERGAVIGNTDYSAAFIPNVDRNRRAFTMGLRFAPSLWYSQLLWRFQFGLRPSVQMNISPRLNLYPYIGVDGGVRFLIFSFLSIESYFGPRLGAQLGRDDTNFVTGYGTLTAWLFHPWRDNRRRFRLGFETFQLHPTGVDDGAGIRHIGFFFGFETFL